MMRPAAPSFASSPSHQTVEPRHPVDEDRPQRQPPSGCGKGQEQPARTRVLQQKGADEPATHEDDHGHDVVPLGRNLIQPQLHRPVMDDEGPDHDLGADIEELCHHSLHVPLVAEEAAQSGSDVEGAIFLTVRRHSDDGDRGEYHGDHENDADVGSPHDRQILCREGGQLRRPHRAPLRRGGRIESGENELLGDEHPHERAHGVERLGQVQAPRGGLLGPHGQDVGVGTGLEKGESACESEVGHEEWPEHGHHAARNEEERPRGVESQSHQDPGLVRVALDEQGRRECHGEVAAIEGELHQGSLEIAHLENAGERLHHGVGDVVCESPQREQERDQDEGEKQTSRNDLPGLLRLLHIRTP